METLECTEAKELHTYTGYPSTCNPHAAQAVNIFRPTVSLPFCHVACSGSKEQETALQSALGTDVSLRCFAGLWICIIERPHLPGSLSLCHRL